MKISGSLRFYGGLTLIFVILLLCFQNAQAGSATWNLNPTSGDWNTAANWMPNTVPDGPNDIATFDVSIKPTSTFQCTERKRTS